MAKANAHLTQEVPDRALQADAVVVATPIGTQETEAGDVS